MGICFFYSHPWAGFAKAALNAGVAELVDAPDLGSGAARRGGSSPFTRTNSIKAALPMCMTGSFPVDKWIIANANLSKPAYVEP